MVVYAYNLSTGKTEAGGSPELEVGMGLGNKILALLVLNKNLTSFYMTLPLWSGSVSNT